MKFVERGIFWACAVSAIVLVNATTRQALSAWKVGTPIVTFFGGHDLDATIAQRDIAGGYNVDWGANWNEVAVAGQYGLRTRLRSDFYLGNLLWPESLDGGVKQAQLNALIDQYKTYPSAYAYYITDEPTTTTEIDRWAPLIAHLRTRDPDRLAYLNMGAPSWTGDTLWQHYINTVRPQMLSYDFYNFMKTSEGANYDEPYYFSNLGKVAGWAKANNIPFMNTVQACTWESSWRTPNENELRFLVYSTLTYGAQGISYFNYYTNNPNDPGGIQFKPDGTPTEIYKSLAKLNPEFLAIAKQYQSLTWIGAYLKGYRRSSGPPGTEQLPASSPFNIASISNTRVYNSGDAVQGVLFGLFDTDGTAVSDATVVLVQNLDYLVSKTYTLTGPGNLSIFDPITGIWTVTGSNRAILNLPPGGGLMVGLTSVVPEPSSVILAMLSIVLGSTRKRFTLLQYIFIGWSATPWRYRYILANFGHLRASPHRTNCRDAKAKHSNRSTLTSDTPIT